MGEEDVLEKLQLLRKLRKDLAPLTLRFENGRWNVLEDNTVIWWTDSIPQLQTVIERWRLTSQ